MTDVRDPERGAALITVLTMVTIMAAIAVFVVDASRMSVRRAFNQISMEQTRWYLIGAETFAAHRINAMLRLPTDQRPDQTEWQAREIVYPLDDGQMRLTLRDGSNCFNLNSVVDQGEAGVATPSGRGMVQFARLLDLMEVRADNGGAAANLADWIDADSVTIAGASEDMTYVGASRRPPNTLIADMAELREVRGFDADTINRIFRVACVRPTAAPNQINPNTLLLDDAPVLASAIADLGLDAARQIIRDRPRGGWEGLDDFFSHALLRGIGATEAMRTQFSFDSAYFILTARVEREAGAESSAVLLRNAPGGIVVSRRVFGAGAEGYRL